MSKTETLAQGNDFIDTMVGLSPEHDLYAIRHARSKASTATQGCQTLFFKEDLEGLSLAERYLVAWYIALLSQAPSLAGEYRRQLQHVAVSDQVLMAVEFDRIDDISDARLRELLRFTRILTLTPTHGDRAALRALQDAGLSTPAIIALAQLIGYLSYQVRLVAGLQAMKAFEEGN